MNDYLQAGDYIEFRTLDGRMTEQSIGFDYFQLFTRNKAPEGIWYDPNDPLVSQTSRGPVEDAPVSDSEGFTPTVSLESDRSENESLDEDPSDAVTSVSLTEKNTRKSKLSPTILDSPSSLVFLDTSGKAVLVRNGFLVKLRFLAQAYAEAVGKFMKAPLRINASPAETVTQMVVETVLSIIEALTQAIGLNFDMVRSFFDFFQEMNEKVYKEYLSTIRTYYDKLVLLLEPLVAFLPEKPVQNPEGIGTEELDWMNRINALVIQVIEDVSIPQVIRDQFSASHNRLLQACLNTLDEWVKPKKTSESLLAFLVELSKELRGKLNVVYSSEDKGITRFIVNLNPMKS